MSEMTVDPGHSDALAAEYVLGTLDPTSVARRRPCSALTRISRPR